MSVRRVCVLAIGLSIASILTGCGARTALSEGRVDATDARSEDAAPKTDVTASDACTVQIKIFDLSSTVPWMDTGLDVAAGVTLTIVATGTVRYGGDPKQVVGPNGVNFDGQQFFPTAVLADAIVIALIGKIGGTHAFDTGVPIPEGAPARGPRFRWRIVRARDDHDRAAISGLQRSAWVVRGQRGVLPRNGHDRLLSHFFASVAFSRATRAAKASSDSSGLRKR
ncbi:hypothetical protein BH09MYX1_BH09MYX1_58640 [soil metagenome]